MEIKKTLWIENEEIEYFIHYKKIKHVYLRIDNGKIKISAPFYCPLPIIEQFLNDRYALIKNKIQNYEPDVIYQDGGYVYFLGKRYPLILRDMNVAKVVIKEESFVVYHKNMKTVLDRYLQDYLYRYIKTIIDYYCQKEPRFPVPVIELKKTKRRYGACFYQRNKVSFNPILVHKDKRFIDYVIVHELCHFIHPNHSPAFYAEIEKWIPDYKTIMKEGEQHENNLSQ